MEHQRLGKSGLRVSKIILGCMSYGSPLWGASSWVLPEEESLPLIKAAYDAGINTWDTADVYSNGESEKLVRTAMEKYSIPRSKLVIMTKIFGVVDESDIANRVNNPAPNEWVNEHGLSRKHIITAVENSVKRLGTHIDVLQIHRLDHETESEEIMRALHDVVQSGQVRYIGASSMRAHEFATLQYTAILHNWTPFISMQPFYNLLYREEEREMLPFCRKTGVGIIPWSPLSRGVLARPYPADPTAGTTREQSDQVLQALKGREQQIDREIVGRVESVAKKRGVSMAIVGLAWVLSKGCCPIVGLGSEKRIAEAVESLKFVLTEDEKKYLEEAYQSKEVFGHA
ncbi:Aldo/keto reductase [Ilyonectria sp. MPI-CAGE-AT-0026]|nr:Aldo/keto reductase [Ilyonectria sp. MPI-CAGE-AT-0026]